MRRTPESVDGLGLDLLDALTLLAKDRVRSGGLRLVGEDGLLPAITQHLMQAALEAELEEHLAAEAERAGGRGDIWPPLGNFCWPSVGRTTGRLWGELHGR
ncbi:hypothetical protein ACH4CE_17045 [Streptomyces gelaticus]|uniref:hypothetical protein n=1 Tax=Streptomyces gelaticus TaxID=285446 RepID=UPI0037A0E1B8